MRNKKKLKIGFIGCGEHAKINLLPCLQYVPVELSAICAKHMKNAETCAKLFGAQNAYDDYSELLGREKLDAVFIAVGPEQHFEMCSKALQNGCHVFVEKPAAKNLDQAKKLQKVAEKSKKHIMVGFMKRFAPTYQKAKQIIDSREFSPLSVIDTKFCVGPDKSENNFLINVAIHHLDLIRYFGGEIKRLQVEKQCCEKDGAFSFSIAVKFENGAIGSIFISSGQSWFTHNERVELSGKRHFMIIDNIISFKYYKDIPFQPGTCSDIRKSNIFWEPNFTVPSKQNQLLFLNGFINEISYFVNSILQGTKPGPDIADFCRTMQLIESIQS